MKDFCLSDKIGTTNQFTVKGNEHVEIIFHFPNGILLAKDVKEAVRLWKEKLNNPRSENYSDRYMVGIEAGITLAIQEMNKIFGDELTK